METVVDVTVPPDEFVLGETLQAVPDVEFEAVRLAVNGSERALPFLWGTTEHPDELDAALRSDSAVERVARLSRDAGRCLFSIEWSSEDRKRIEKVVESDGSVLEARGTPERWSLRVLFPDRATASETYQSWSADGLGATLCRVNNLSRNGDGCKGLSPKQHSAIVTAFETDYYDVPRGTTLEELATNFEVSHQALSESLRRGHSNLVETMVTGPPDEPEQFP